MIYSLQLNKPPTETIQLVQNAITHCFPDAKFLKVQPKEQSSWNPFGKKNEVVETFFVGLSDTDKILVSHTSLLHEMNLGKMGTSELVIFLTELLDKEATSILRKALKKVPKTKLIACSHTIKASCIALGEDVQVAVAYPPIIDAARAAKKQAHNSFIVGIVSPLIEHQGIETVIEAFNHNKEFLPQLTLILIGDGPEKKRLQWLVDHLHLRRRVQFASSQENYQRFLPNFDAVVLPNLKPIGFNPVLPHAFAQGVPVIASQLGIHAELIEQGKSGLLFEPGNSHMLAQHLLNLYNHPDWRDHYQQKGLQLVQTLFSRSNFCNAVSRSS